MMTTPFQNNISYSPYSRKYISSDLEDLIFQESSQKHQSYSNFERNIAGECDCLTQKCVCRICKIEFKTKGILDNHIDFDHFKNELENLVQGNRYWEDGVCFLL